jgi:hemoglobin/transferrin/lactoferrin receptor protein
MMIARARAALALVVVTLIGWNAARAQDVPPPIEPDLGGAKKPSTAASGSAPVSTAAAGAAPVSSATTGQAILPDVLVTAPTGNAERLFDTTVGINVISRQKLEEEMPRFLSDALRFQPGLWASQSVIGQAGAPIIRGLQGAQILMIQDGVRLTNSPGADAGPSLDFDTIDAANLDHIEVLRSPDSVLYGTQAIGGVVATSTRIPIDFPKEGFAYGARNTFTYSSSDFTRRDHLDVYGASPDIRLSLGFTYLDAGDMKMGDGAGVAHPTAYDLAAGDFHLEWQPTALQTFKVWFSVAHKEYDGVFLTPLLGEHSFFDRKIVALSWQNQRATPLYDMLEAQVSFLRYERSNDRTDIFDDVDRIVQTPTIDLKLHKMLFETNALMYGLHFHLDDTTWTEDSSAGKTAPVPSGWVGDVAGFVQDEWDVLPQLRLVAGLRLDGVRTETFPRVATTNPLFNVNDLEVRENDFAVTGKVGALYHVFDPLNLSANFSRGYRSPQLADVAGFNVRTTGITAGNGSLHSEYSNTFELGARTESEWFRGSISGFASWYDHLIVTTNGTLDGMSSLAVNGQTLPVFQQKNAGNANSQGVELEGDVPIHPVPSFVRADLYGNFTWMILTTHPQDTSDVRGSPTNGTLGIRLSDPTDSKAPTWWVAFESHMVAHFTRMPDSLYQSVYTENPQIPGSPPLRSHTIVPGYTLFDLRGGYRFCDHATLDLGIENLLNRDYRPVQSRHDGPGITFLASMTVSF